VEEESEMGGGGGHSQVVISKAMLLEESAMRARGHEQMCTQRSTSRVGQRSRKEEEEDEWDAELRAMEGREKKRQLGLLRMHMGDGGRFVSLGKELRVEGPGVGVWIVGWIEVERIACITLLDMHVLSGEDCNAAVSEYGNALSYSTRG
jgi:ATP:corrinoid adenosyltransferase